jgi:hypothetical protein
MIEVFHATGERALCVSLWTLITLISHSCNGCYFYHLCCYGHASSDLHILNILTSSHIYFFSAGMVFLRAVLKYVCFSNTGLIGGSELYFACYMCAKFSFQLASVISGWTVRRIIMY